MATAWDQLYANDENFRAYVLEVVEEARVPGLSPFDRRSFLDAYREGQQQQIQFETTSFDQIDAAIVNSTDVTGTVQTGWRRENDMYFSKPIFLREHLSMLKEHLDAFMGHGRLRHLYISGPPGSGKTTYCLFYFTRYMVTNNRNGHNKKGLIVQYRETGSNEVMILENQHIRRVTSSSTASPDLPKLVIELIQKEGGREAFDFCVFDGMRQAEEFSKSINSSITNSVGTNTKFIKVTSLEFAVKGGDATGGLYGIDDFFVGSSWKLEDYEEAVKAKLLGVDELQRILCLDSDFEADDEDAKMEDAQNEVKGDPTEVTFDWLLSLLKRKYFYAGGSARYMFDCSIDELIVSTPKQPSVFERLCGRMTDADWSTFATLRIGAYTKSSVSLGMQRIDGKYIPVSEYFLLVAHTYCKAKLTASVRAAAKRSGNPALKGWAFELEQLDVIEKMIKTDPGIIVSEDRALVLPLGSGETTTYDGMSMDGVASDVFTIWCGRWNQGCFGVAFYVKSSLVTMNFTVAESHSLKINPLRDLKALLDSLGKKVRSLVHIAVVEEKAKCANFSFGEAEGVGRSTEMTEFSVQTARSVKLTADIDPQLITDQAPLYGTSLSTVQVFPREWTSPRCKRKKVD